MVDEIQEIRDQKWEISTEVSLHYLHAKKHLTAYYHQRQQAYNTNNTHDPKFWEYVTLFKEHAISIAYSDAFFESMLMDCDMHRYQTYEQLDHYMYGSAAVIGLMMCELMGKIDPRAIPHAHALGDAMQMTNFLRDIKEDYLELNRIYLPSDDLSVFGLSHADIQDFCKFWQSKNLEKRNQFVLYMQDEIAKARVLYRAAEQGYQYLPKEGRRAVELSAKLYEGILDKIERNDYNVFCKSARTNFLQKMKIVVQYFFSL